MTFDDITAQHALEPWHQFLIGQILSAHNRILYINCKIFLCPHSFLFYLSKIWFFVADWIGLFLLSHLSSSFPVLSNTAWRDLWAKSKRVVVIRFSFLSTVYTCVYAAVCSSAISHQFDNWIFTLEQPDSC